MRKQHLIILLTVAFSLLSAHAQATTTTACPTTQPVYFTNGNQILCADATTGSRTVLVTDTTDTVFFADLALGPDGRLYVDDSLGNRVFRFNPTSASTLDRVATLPSGATPGGLAFSGSDGDLYVITNIGVFRLKRIASLFAMLVMIPIDLSTSNPDIPLSITAGGDAFGETGTLLIVNQAGKGTVLSADPVIGSVTPYPNITNSSLITNFANKPSSTSPGVAVNTCGDILVASANVIERFGSDGTLLNSSFASVAGTHNIFQYMEVDANNVLWAVTNNTSGSTPTGILWRIDPVVPLGGDPITSCASGVATQVGTSIAGGASGLAIGLAPTLTDHTITKTFGAPGPDGICGTADDILSPTSNTYFYGHHSWAVIYKAIFHCFSQSFTATRKRPIDVGFDTTLFQDKTRCALYPSMGGFCIQYRTPEPAPQPSIDFAAAGPDGPAIKAKVGYFDPLGLFSDPGLARCPDTFPNTVGNACNLDVTHDFYPTAVPGTDDGNIGDPTGWSRYVVFNEPLPLAFGDCTIQLKEPALSNNPPFTFGATIRVAFNLTHPDGSTCANAFERLSVLRTNPLPLHPEVVVSKNNSNQDNIFNFSSNLYTFPLDSSAFQVPPGVTLGSKTKVTYEFTIFGNGAPPFSFLITVLF